MGPIIKPGDLVQTPTGRPAVVMNIRSDGKRDCNYTDQEGGQVALATKDLKLVKSMKPRPWPSHSPV